MADRPTPAVPDSRGMADRPAHITPEPTEEEAVAIVAAIDAAWPRAVAAASGTDQPPRWRFSGRWWTKPIPIRRDRPW
jgi:hypothetical protein